MNPYIEFYFDFSSPYGYLASHLIDNLAVRCGRDVIWRPMMLGVAMRQTGSSPLVGIPIKGTYSCHDIVRTARRHDIPFVIPDEFPIAALAVSRAYYWISETNTELGNRFAKEVFSTYFSAGKNISSVSVVTDIAAALAVDKDSLLLAIKSNALKDRLKKETNVAVERGVFGSPFFFVDGEPFWGVDRLDDMEQWLVTGGW